MLHVVSLPCCVQTKVMKNSGRAAVWDERLRLTVPGPQAAKGVSVVLRVRDGDNTLRDKDVGFVRVPAPLWVDGGEAAVDSGFADNRWYSLLSDSGAPAGQLEVAMHWERMPESTVATSSDSTLMEDVGDGMLLLSVIAGANLPPTKRVRPHSSARFCQLVSADLFLYFLAHSDSRKRVGFRRCVLRQRSRRVVGSRGGRTVLRRLMSSPVRGLGTCSLWTPSRLHHCRPLETDWKRCTVSCSRP
jgi:hypothetical protein